MAPGAETVQLEAVVADEEPLPARDLALDGLDGGVLELLDRSAIQTHQVVVVPDVDPRFVAHAALVEPALLGDPGLHEQAHVPVDRGASLYCMLDSVYERASLVQYILYSNTAALE